MIARNASRCLALVLLTTPAIAHAATGDGLVLQVRNALVHNHLAPRPQCLDYKITRNSDPGVDRIDVSVRHTAVCGGDPLLEEHLSAVYIDQRTQQMGTDAADPTGGTLKLLPP